MENKIKTAEQFATELLSTINDWAGDRAKNVIIRSYFIEFAKLHCEAQQEAILEKANMIGETQHLNNAPVDITDFVYVSDSNGPDYGYRVNKDSILNAYPLSNIN